MSDRPYLLELGARLTAGLARWEGERRHRHRDFLLSKQNEDGGFSGREGGSDLYYTGFAVRGLSILGTFPEAVAVRVGGYLLQHLRGELTVVDLVSWLYSALMVQGASGRDLLSDFTPQWPELLGQMLESFRTQDGGYAKGCEGATGSTYHTFLVLLCYELIGQRAPGEKRVIQFMFDRQRDDGGFVEIEPMKRSGTNPTAAAVAVLRMLNAFDDDLRDDTRRFLASVYSDEGGFQANTRIPFADGLSTFTGLLTAQDLQLPELYNREKFRAFIDSLEFPTGGFRGASWDQAADVEYTFYGLGTLALLATSSRAATDSER